MINPEDLRIGDLVRLSRDCIFPKGTMCTVADIRTEIEHKDKKGVVSLNAINDEDDGPWGTWCCNIEGIPITPEILEKNGFKVRVSRVYYTKLIEYANFLQRNIAIERKRNDWAVFIRYKKNARLGFITPHSIHPRAPTYPLGAWLGCRTKNINEI